MLGITSDFNLKKSNSRIAKGFDFFRLAYFIKAPVSTTR